MLTHSSISCQENTADRGTWVGGYSPWSCGELDVTGATKHAEKLLRLNTHAYVYMSSQMFQGLGVLEVVDVMYAVLCSMKTF